MFSNSKVGNLRPALTVIAVYKKYTPAAPAAAAKVMRRSGQISTVKQLEPVPLKSEEPPPKDPWP